MAQARSRADIRLLGPVEVIGPGGSAGLIGVRQNALVALLALNAGTVVARSRLIDALWGEDPPRTAVRTLQSHVTRARQALRGCGLLDTLLTREPGYLLAVDRAEVDAIRFEDAVLAARQEAAGAAPDRAVTGLRSALALWRGDLTMEGTVAGWAARELERLAELRLAAVEELWELELHLGGHAAAIGELDRMLTVWPNRERLVGLLMLALYRAGRSADALERFERFRVRLADELGADPGPALRDLHVAILRHDPALDPATEEPAAAPVPAQLPPSAGHFAGRDAELAGLDRPGARIVAVCGTAGVGKTALAVQWAQGVRTRFPDGQIFLDLHGHDPDAALPPEAVLTHALRALGVPGGRVPAELAGQTALYRSLVAGKRILLVLDNAGTADHVLPLVPPGEHGLLLVTSRGRLAALAVQHVVHTVELAMLGPDEAMALLERIIGPARPRAEETAAQQLLELCDRLPLALRIAAAKLASRPRRPISELVTELSGADRLDVLATGGSAGVRAVFASAYHALSEPAARLLRLLGLHPGTSFTTQLAAALAGIAHGRARRGVDELAAAHLIVDTGTASHRFHDLIRLYAAERARAEETPAGRAETADRILDWYLALAFAANQVLDPARDRVQPGPWRDRVEVPFPASRPAVLAFLDGEHANLMAVLGHAARHGHDEVTWRLCYLLAGYFESRGHYRDRIVAYQHGLVAARRLGEPATEALMRSGLGIAHFAARDYPSALEHLDHALRLAVASGDRRGEGHVRNNIAAALGELGRFDDAIAAGELALAVHEANGHDHGITLALNNLGCAHARSGRLESALALLTRGLERTRRDGDARLEAAILHSTGEAYQRVGEHAAALELFGQALSVRRQQGDRRYTAHTLAEIGATRLAAGDSAGALAGFQEAQAVGRVLGDQHLDAVLLAGLGQAHLELGDLAAARRYLEQAGTLRARVPDSAAERRLRASLALLAERTGAGADPAIGPATVALTPSNGTRSLAAVPSRPAARRR